MGASCPGRSRVGALPPDLLALTCDGSPAVNDPRLVQHALRCWAAYQPSTSITAGVFPGLKSGVFGPDSAGRRCLNLYSAFWSALGDFPMVVMPSPAAGDPPRRDVLGGDSGDGGPRQRRQQPRRPPRLGPQLGLRAHSGYAEVSHRALLALHPLVAFGQPLRLTGHSLGGAVAALLGLRLQRAGHSVAEVVTFGAPKFTDNNGRDLAGNLPLLRVTNARDPVPACPPLGDYVHVGHELRYDTATGRRDWRPDPQMELTPLGLDDHPVTAYLSNLLAFIPDPDPSLTSSLKLM
jgi:hypothetical protein